ncbi:MAG: DeoR/GlpR family DNA-binding transcription regulator [Bacillota bacterium]
MFAEERLAQIIKILNEKGKVVVKELSEAFDVTEDCIRKDLKTLEKDGRIKRTYGGAVLTRQPAPISNVYHRRTVNLEAKKIIAEKAFNIIAPKETIFLDISTTNILIAEKLAKSSKQVTVITNMIDIITTFTNCEHIKVIGIGGVFHKELDGFTGSSAIESILKYKVDKAFIGSVGVNIFDRGVTTFDVEDGNTKKAIMSTGKESYLVIENRKFYVDGVYRFADLLDIDVIIVDEKPEDNICEELKKMNVMLL